MIAFNRKGDRNMWNKIKQLGLVSVLAATLMGCNNDKPAEDKIKIGTIAGPETALMEVAKGIAKRKYQLDIEIVEFQDYVTPNAALADGTLDANAFQTMQYFNAAKAAKGYDLVVAGKTFIYPMGLYSKRFTDIESIPEGAKVAIPNDPSNEERALLLLEKAGLIKLGKSEQSLTAQNITENTKKLDIITLDAAQLPRSLDDVALSAINTNYAVLAGLYPTKDALVSEGADSPYVNIIATRPELEKDQRMIHFIASYQSPEVVMKAEELFKGQAIPAWMHEKALQ